MPRLSRRWGVAPALVALCAAPPAAHAAVNLVTNGSFESYTTRSVPIGPTDVLFTGLQPDDWDVKLTFGSRHAVVNTAAADAYAGSAWYRFVSVDSPLPDQISQEIPTEPGVEYTLSFALQLVADTPPGMTQFVADWGGTGGFYSGDVTPFLNRYTVVTATVIGGPGETTTLTFRGFSNTRDWRLDDVSVVAVPEPATVMLIGAGLLLTLPRRRTGR